MFSELPKLLGRNFAVGFFLPSTIFIAVSLWIADAYGYLGLFLTYAQGDLLVGTTVIGLIAWLGGILLLVMNRWILRIFQGYGKWNPFQFRRETEYRRYLKAVYYLNQLKLSVKAKLAYGDGAIPPKLINEYADAYKQRIKRFPDQERFLLPTAFGNTIRAFEVYSRVMYGLDIIPGLNHLRTVIPESYSDLIDSAKAQMNFWINICVVSLLLIIHYAAAAAISWQANLVGLAAMLVAVSLIAPRQAQHAAVQWGETIKAAFDVYLPDLADKLRLKIPKSRDEERAVWQNFTQAITYRLPEQLPEKAEPKVKPSSNGTQPVTEKARQTEA